MSKKIVAAQSILLMLAACGGGGGGGGGGSGTVIYDYTQGISSSENAADNAISNGAAMSLPYTSPGGAHYASLQIANTTLNAGNDLVATNDTNARSAWRSGWTGKNVKIGVADDFDNNGQLDTHGDWVSLIIGSVAPEANFYYIDMLGTARTATADQALQYFEDNGYHIINASWGIDRFDQTTGQENLNFDAQVNSLVQSFDQNAEKAKQALIIYAAGNSGYYCASKRSEYCSLEQAKIMALRDAGKTAGENTIIVGSLVDGSNAMAGYSIIAGDLKNDFIVAHDDVVTTGDAAGTSFAAPRVTGAAGLVRHKFPNLTSSQLKQVLLQTATDLGAEGVDEIYGYGKLNVLGALSPIGNVVPK